MTSLCLDILNGEQGIEELNITLIVLVLKVKILRRWLSLGYQPPLLLPLTLGLFYFELS